MKTVYIIIPVFNGEKYIKRCLDSVFNQTYKNFVVVCVNDGSTDNSLKILSEYKNVIVLNKSNGGLSSARNFGLDYIYNHYKDGYISFIDCDDYIKEDYFETLLRYAKDNNADIVCSSFINTYEDRESRSKVLFNGDCVFSAYEATKLLVEDKTIQSHAWCKLYKFKLFSDIRFPINIKFMEDQCTIYKTFCLANIVYVTNYAGYYYWLSGTSLIRSKNTNRKLLDALRSYYSVSLYNFPFSRAENEALVENANHALADAFLMLLPRLNKRTFANDEKLFFKELVAYIKKNKVIKKYKPENKNSKLKRKAYLYLRPFYKILFKLFS